jgi:hypothetical protein
MQQQKCVTHSVDSLSLWKIVNEEDAVLIPKNRDKEFLCGFMQPAFLGAMGGLSRYPGILLIVALSPGHSDMTRFRPRSPIVTGNHVDSVKRKNPKLLRRLAPVTFLIRV